MYVVAQFDITSTHNLQILVPRFQEKYNVCYETTPELHIFDVGKVMMYQEDQAFAVTDDCLGMLVHDWQEQLDLLLHNKFVLDDFLEVGSVGSWYNYATYHGMDKEHDLCLQHNVWPTSRWKKTFLYRNEDAYYLEIAPVYRWLYDNPPRDDEVVSFEEFMRTYQPCVVQELTKSSIITWLKHSEELIKFFSSGTTSEQERATV